MAENHTIQLAEIPIGGKAGAVWNRLHSQREDVCEALLKYSEAELQTRLRKIDDALDHLMAGSYGLCSQCGRAIDAESLDDDPACALCLDCEHRELSAAVNDSCEIMLQRLISFDTILVRTHHSEYRILLLDPGTGRALIEGGSYLPEPSEGLVKGSAVPGEAFNAGAISVGGRLELWVNGKVFLTSTIKSVEVKHNFAAGSPEYISAALHQSIA